MRGIITKGWNLISLSDYSKLNPKKSIKVHLEIDTGMNRSGIHQDQVEEFVREYNQSNLQLEGIMSHLVMADSDDDTTTQAQLLSLEKSIDFLLGQIRQPDSILYYHLSNTHGLKKTSNQSRYLNTSRIGIGLYGWGHDDLKPCLELITQIDSIRKVQTGQKVSYSSLWTANRESIIATIPVGYNEALPRSLTNLLKIRLVNNDQEYIVPVVGRICMNLCMLDITDLPKSLQNIGQSVQIISSDHKDCNSVTKICELSDGFIYEFLCQINSSIERRIA